MGKREDLVSEIERSGLKLLKQLTNKDLERVVLMIKGGTTTEDLKKEFEDAFSGTIKDVPDPPPPPSEKPQEAPAPTFTAEQMERMLANVAEKAAEAGARAAVAALKKENAAQPVAKKPIKPSDADTPKEYWDKAGLTIFHSGDHHCMDHFLVDGRVELCPRSVLILFTSAQASNVQRFGNSVNIQYLCKYHTHDKREIDLFRNDVRWGTEFWDGSGRVLDAQTELGMLMVSKVGALNGVGFDQLRQMCIDRGLELGTIPIMRAKIASHDSKLDQERQAQLANKRLDDAEKARMLAEKPAAGAPVEA